MQMQNETYIMKYEDILRISEGSTIELKEIINESLFKTLSAFANTNGGILYIGISDKKEIKGLHCQNSTIEELTNKIVNKLGIHPQIDCLKVDDKNIIKIETKKSTLPVSYEGRYYKRIGNTSREMQGEELRAFFVKGTSWDGLTGDYNFDEIDAETVRKFVSMAVNNSDEGARLDLSMLVEKGILVSQGAGRGVSYVLK